MPPALEAELDHVALNCGIVDPLTAARWYTNVLGFEPIDFDEYGGGRRPFPSVRVSSNCILDFFESENGHGSKTCHLNHICFALRDRETLNTAIKRLKDAGYGPENETPIPRSGARGEGMSVYAEDIIGNVIELRYYE
jgi:catechol 2,3-dioxygenase-like lactoylglutathione lyase family enzyme